MKKQWIAGILFVTLMIFLAGCGRQSDVVAKIGDEKIKIDEFKEALTRKYPSKDFNDISLEEKKQVVQELIDRRLKILKARALELDQDPEFVAEMKNRANNFMAQKLYENRIVDHLISEELLRAFYKLDHSQIKTVVIAIGFDDAERVKANRNKKQAVALAEQLVQRIKNGEDAQQLAKQYSDDTRLKKVSGLLNPYNSGMFHWKVDRELASAAAHEVIGPVATANGVYVLKILDYKNLDKATDFESQKTDLKKRLYQRYFSQEGMKMYRKKTEEYQKKLNAEIFNKELSKFVTILQEWSRNPQAKEDDFTSAQRAIVLAQVGDHQITIGELIDQFKGRLMQYAPRLSNLSALQKLVNNRLEYLLWVKMAEENGLNKNPDVREKIRDFKRKKLAELFDKRELKQKNSLTEDELQAYYDNHKADYVEPAKIKMWQIVVDDQELANKIYRQAVSGDSEFEELARKYAPNDAMKRRGGDMGYQRKGSALGPVIDAAFKAGEDQIVGPVAFREKYYVIKTGDLKPERQKNLQEVRGLVRAALLREKEKTNRQTLMDELRKEYVFWINESLLRKIS